MRSFLVFRHDDALGNSAEQVLGLAQFLEQFPLQSADRILVEHTWQRAFVSLIPGIDSSQILTVGDAALDFFRSGWQMDFAPDLVQRGEILVPSVYSTNVDARSRGVSHFPSGWADLQSVSSRTSPWFLPQAVNQLPRELQDIDVVVQFRERGAWSNRDPRNHEPHRYVAVKKYHSLIYRLAALGLRVARLGSPKQVPLLPKNNVVDVAHSFWPDLSRDFALIARARLMLSSDASIWPIAPGLGTTLVMADVVSPYALRQLLGFRNHHLCLSAAESSGVDFSGLFPLSNAPNRAIVQWLDDGNGPNSVLPKLVRPIPGSNHRMFTVKGTPEPKIFAAAEDALDL